ncbi:hypothetical protein RvY_13932-2 [Ramazzottius varieornatus]|uniref:Uncharacterized protein n=1 Tax=Ramazzottius varieornatus TaxID=947166 RepID=A0A1D1VWZ2_RAMVA|nr:hypothetical protein RvY_13932-2 [Ramazzottius varieornatus]
MKRNSPVVSLSLLALSYPRKHVTDPNKNVLHKKSRTCSVLLNVVVTPIIRRDDLGTEKSQVSDSERAQSLYDLVQMTSATRSLSKIAEPWSQRWRRFITFSDIHHISLQAASTAVYIFAGNVLEQMIVENKNYWTVDWSTVIKFTVINLFIVFPITYGWLSFLEKRLVPPGSQQDALKKTALDQFVFVPLFTAFFICLIGLIDSRGWEDTRKRFGEQDWLAVLGNNFRLWPLIQYLNFSYIHFNRRILFIK